MPKIFPKKKSCQNRKMQKYPKCKRKKSQIAKKKIFSAETFKELTGFFYQCAF